MASARTPISRDIAAGRLRPGGAGERVNVNDTERWLSAAGGGLLALLGMARRDAAGLGLAALGGALVYRGLTGHCRLYQALGVDTARPHGAAASVAAGRGVRVNRAVTIDASPQEI